MTTRVNSVTFEVFGRPDPLAMATVKLYARKDSRGTYESVKDVVGRLKSETDALFRIKEVENVAAEAQR